MRAAQQTELAVLHSPASTVPCRRPLPSGPDASLLPHGSPAAQSLVAYLESFYERTQPLAQLSKQYEKVGGGT